MTDLCSLIPVLRHNSNPLHVNELTPQTLSYNQKDMMNNNICYDFLTNKQVSGNFTGMW
jgi:hypothetical protein